VLVNRGLRPTEVFKRYPGGPRPANAREHETRTNVAPAPGSDAAARAVGLQIRNGVLADSHDLDVEIRASGLEHIADELHALRASFGPDELTDAEPEPNDP
jgi:hypothetical protein